MYTPAAVVKVDGCGDDYRRGYGRDFDPLSWLAANGTSEVKDTIHNQTVMNGQGFCDVQAKVGDAECRVTHRIGDMEARITNQNTDNFGKLMLHTIALERDIQRLLHTQHVDNTREFGSLRLQACETENRLSRQLADCCCKLEAKIDASEISRLKDELDQARLKIQLRDQCCTPAQIRVP